MRWLPDRSGTEKEGTRLKKNLMEILACPVCKGELVLRIDEEVDDEVLAGSLFCGACDESYPIEDSIPNLLPPELRQELAQ